MGSSASSKSHLLLCQFYKSCTCDRPLKIQNSNITWVQIRISHHLHGEPAIFRSRRKQGTKITVIRLVYLVYNCLLVMSQFGGVLQTSARFWREDFGGKILAEDLVREFWWENWHVNVFVRIYFQLQKFGGKIKCEVHTGGCVSSEFKFLNNSAFIYSNFFNCSTRWADSCWHVSDVITRHDAHTHTCSSFSNSGMTKSVRQAWIFLDFMMSA